VAEDRHMPFRGLAISRRRW